MNLHQIGEYSQGESVTISYDQHFLTIHKIYFDKNSDELEPNHTSINTHLKAVQINKHQYNFQ